MHAPRHSLASAETLLRQELTERGMVHFGRSGCDEVRVTVPHRLQIAIAATSHGPIATLIQAWPGETAHSRAGRPNAR